MADARLAASPQAARDLWSPALPVVLFLAGLALGLLLTGAFDA